MGWRQGVLIGGAALCHLLLAGCIASNVVAPEQRLVVTDIGELAFAPAPDLVLDGLYESVDVRGDAAQSLRKVYYLFAAKGSYTAAALTEAGGAFAFQTLDGTWQNGPEGLVLDGREPVLLEQASGHLRLTASAGSLVMVRRELQ